VKILHPTDGSETAYAALEFAIGIAKAQRSKIIVLSVAKKLSLSGDKWKEMEEILLELAQENVEKAVREIQKREVDVVGKVKVGKPAEVIVDMAKREKIYAIVMGTHGWMELPRSVIGSVADRVIRHAPCPVVLVPAKVKGKKA
jgi:nucleotide-binding universal stress UspA family protein